MGKTVTGVHYVSILDCLQTEFQKKCTRLIHKMSFTMAIAMLMNSDVPTCLKFPALIRSDYLELTPITQQEKMVCEKGILSNWGSNWRKRIPILRCRNNYNNKNMEGEETPLQYLLKINFNKSVSFIFRKLQAFLLEIVRIRYLLQKWSTIYWVQNI